MLASLPPLIPHVFYGAQQVPELKALSGEEIRGLLNGDGMGTAKVAELNHYPGPRHVLDLAYQSNLSEKQRKETQKIFDKMREEAVRLGKLIRDTPAPEVPPFFQ